MKVDVKMKIPEKMFEIYGMIANLGRIMWKCKTIIVFYSSFPSTPVCHDAIVLEQFLRRSGNIRVFLIIRVVHVMSSKEINGMMGH